jgi:hypothetical protein
MPKKPKTFEEQLGLKYGVGHFTMTDVQPNGMVKVGFMVDTKYETVEVDRETAVMVTAAFEGGKDWLREELRLVLNVPEKR